MSRCLIAAVIAVLCTIPASAGDVRLMRLAESESAPPGPMQIASMGEVAVADYWTYELKDEISGAIIQIRKVTVTDVSNGQITTRLDDTQTRRSRSIVYDKSWNIVHDWPNR